MSRIGRSADTRRRSHAAQLSAPTSEVTSAAYWLARAPGVKVQLTAAGREKLIQAALGLTAAQAQRAFAQAIVGDEV